MGGFDYKGKRLRRSRRADKVSALPFALFGSYEERQSPASALSTLHYRIGEVFRMRILGFSQKWPKLNNELLVTTFRYPRRDRDWEVEEVVQVVYKPRSKERQPLGIARIIRKQEKDLSKKFYVFGGVDHSPNVITPVEAYEDGFTHMGGGDNEAMRKFLRDYSQENPDIINKLTLYWIERFNG